MSSRREGPAKSEVSLVAHSWRRKGDRDAYPNTPAAVRQSKELGLASSECGNNTLTVESQTSMQISRPCAVGNGVTETVYYDFWKAPQPARPEARPSAVRTDPPTCVDDVRRRTARATRLEPVT
eukprot:4868119-Prymnesium_polylepis.2